MDGTSVESQTGPIVLPDKPGPAVTQLNQRTASSIPDPLKP